MRVLRVDLSRLSATDAGGLGSTQPPAVCGGRLLTAEILTAEVDPGCKPLGPENRLVLATGPPASRGCSFWTRIACALSPRPATGA